MLFLICKAKLFMGWKQLDMPEVKVKIRNNILGTNNITKEFQAFNNLLWLILLKKGFKYLKNELKLYFVIRYFGKSSNRFT